MMSAVFNLTKKACERVAKSKYSAEIIYELSKMPNLLSFGGEDYLLDRIDIIEGNFKRSHLIEKMMRPGVSPKKYHKLRIKFMETFED